MEIIDLNSSIISVFKMDDLDHHIMNSSSFKALLKTKYKLVLSQIDVITKQIDGSLNFTKGEFQVGNVFYHINRVSFELRRVVINIQADTEIAEKLFSELIDLINEISKREYSPQYVPVVKAYETTAVVKFRDEVNTIFNHTPINSISDIVSKEIDPKGADFSISFQSLRFKISFFNIPENFRNNNVTLADKDFFIERRIHTPTNEAIFFTGSPLDSTQHRIILKQIEDLAKK